MVDEGNQSQPTSPIIDVSPIESMLSTSVGSLATLYSSSLDLDMPSPPDVTPLALDENSDSSRKAMVIGRTARKVYSKVWTHYIKEKVKGKDKARCKYYNQLLLGNPKQDTSHLKKHFERCPNRKMKDIRQQVLQANFNKERFDLSPFNFDREFSRKELPRMIIMHEYPLKMVDHEGFRSFIKSLSPCFKMVTRNTIKSDCIKIYELEKKATMHILEKNEGRVAVTTNMWTSNFQKKGFMAMTTHYIDNNWRLQSWIIRFIYVPNPRTSEALFEALMNAF